MVVMGARVGKYADDFESAQDRFIELVESLDDEQWSRVGKNYPERINEDERRTVGVIAHHVADTQTFIVDRMFLMLEEKPFSPVDFRASNAEHAHEHAGATRDQVVAMLRDNRKLLAARVRTIPDDALDVTHETPAGPATIAQRIERVLIGHLKVHQGSIEAAIA